MKSYLYVIGIEPYEDSHREKKGNGEWSAAAPNAEDALKIIFSSMPFPGEATGRKLFLPSVSIEGVHRDEVIQVWSNEPEIQKRTQTILKQYGTSGLHDGRGEKFGLHMEIKVTDIERYTASSKALLTGPASDNTATALSPMGASLLRFEETKHDMQMAMQREQMELTRKEWEVKSVAEGLREKMSLMKQQIGVLDAYLHGTRHRTQICRGKRGSGKYKVFQSRVFLAEELSLLANFEDFDFKQMEELEKWLIKTGHIWKLLPFDRCILATRIRKDRKEYGDAFANYFNNLENMQNMIWVRDGENVFHVDVDFDFHNAVFPDRNQFDKALQVVQETLWNKSFREKPPTNWHGQRLKKNEYDVMGMMRRKPLEEEEPYFTKRIVNDRFRSLDEWLKSDAYTELLDKQIKQAVQDYLREINKRQMIFAVLLQGIVDNTELLDIPKGTDLFNWETINDYFDLLFDYTHGLPWPGISDKIKPYTNGRVQVGDWVVVILNEYVEPPEERSWAKGTTHKEEMPVLTQVVAMEEIEIRRMARDTNEYITKKVMKPVVKYHPKVKRRGRYMSYEESQNARVKLPIKLTLKNSMFIKVPMPPSLAEQILDNRDWKKDNQWAVPLMVNYRKIISAVKKNTFAVLEWETIKG